MLYPDVMDSKKLHCNKQSESFVEVNTTKMLTFYMHA